MLEQDLKHGAVRDTPDERDYKLEDKCGAPAPFDWVKGYDVEKDLGITIPIKNQYDSESCVGQGNSYLAAVVNALITGKYDETSAKAIYSQIFLPGGGASIRDGIALSTTFGEVLESIVRSYKDDGSVDEAFMEDKAWMTPEVAQMAKNLLTKSYATVLTDMDSWAQAMRDYKGIVAGVEGTNNGTWNSNEPQPPLMTTPQNDLWGHCLFFGKAGIDSLGKFISTPNSWGERPKDALHPDGWQKLRQSWFDNNAHFLFNAWTLIDKIMNSIEFCQTNDLKFIRNSDTGAFGQVIGGQLRLLPTTDRATLCLLDDKVRNGGLNIPNTQWVILQQSNF